jgi:hypothetical protein
MQNKARKNGVVKRKRKAKKRNENIENVAAKSENEIMAKAKIINESWRK